MANNQDAVRLKGPIPITLLSGFLGSGKTTLLRHILSSPDTNLRIAVVVNDMAALNIDAGLVKRHIVSQANKEDSLIQLRNGCICCTLRGDLLEALVKLAKEGQADYIVIESTGISEPMQVAETFTEEFTAAMLAAIEEPGEVGLKSDPNMRDVEIEGAEILREVSHLGGLHKIARLDTLVTMVDAFNFFDNFSTTEFITTKWGKENVSPEDERTVTDLMVDQIEFANVIIINKVATVDADTRQRIRGLMKKLNPQASILEANYGNVNLEQLLNTSVFNFEKAATGMGWLQSLHEMSKREIDGKVKIAPKPETEEYGISSFVYEARRPFQPRRLYEMIRDKFVLMEGATNEEEESKEEDEAADNTAEEATEDDRFDTMDEASDEDMDGTDTEAHDSVSDTDMDEGDDLSKATDPHTIEQNKRNCLIFRGLLRSKGFFWLATRPSMHGEWSQAAEWPQDEATKQSILHDFQEPWGDRRQEIVLIGEKLDEAGLKEQLDACLLTAADMKRWERIMRSRRGDEYKQTKLNEAFSDGFEDWPSPTGMEDHDGHIHSHSHDVHH